MKKITIVSHVFILLFSFVMICFTYNQQNYLSFTLFLLFILLIILSLHIHAKLQNALEVVHHYDISSANQKRLFHLQDTMLELSSHMTKIKDLNELLDIILKKAIEVIPEAEFGSILALNADGQLEFKAIHGFDEELFKVKLYPEECYQWRATGGHFTGPLIIPDLSQFSKYFMNEENYSILNEINALSPKSSLSAPLLIDGQFFGSINIDSSRTNVFTEEHKKLMEYFANQATIAIRNHQYYEKLLFLSKYDDLTGAINRNYFQECAEIMLSESLANQSPLTLAVIDLNNFKAINDQYGHTSGDMILTFFVDAFSSQLTPNDLFARYGGDEFIAVFHDSDFHGTSEKLLSIHDKITKESLQLTPEGVEVHCYFAYGMAEFPKEGAELKNLIHLADQRMYTHKHKLKCE